MEVNSGCFQLKKNTIFRYHKKMHYRLDFTGQSLVVYVGAVQPGGGGLRPPCINIGYRISGLQSMY